MISDLGHKTEVSESVTIMAMRCLLGWARRLCATAMVVLSAGCNSLPVAARSSDSDIQARRDLMWAEQLRGLSLKREIEVAKAGPDQIRESLVSDLAKPENRAYLSATEILLRELGVLKSEESLEQVLLGVMEQQVAAYYDPSTKRVVYVEGGGGLSVSNRAVQGLVDRFVYVHEFCHAVEDSHFDLESMTRLSQSDFDRSMALTSLIEGDAMLVGMDSVLGSSPVNTATPLGAAAVRLIAAGDLTGQAEDLGSCPPFLGGALVRPYLDGAVFSNRIRREAGWGGVDALFTNRLPVSTAEVLYPERRYLRGFKPVSFKLPAGYFSGQEGGVLTNRLGAMGLGLWLGGEAYARPRHDFGFLKGWLGDEIYFLRGADGAVKESTWLSCWERSADARAAARAIEKRLAAGLGNSPRCVVRQGKVVAAVWSRSAFGDGACEQRATSALQCRIDGDFGRPAVWLNEWPWPFRIKHFPGYSRTIEVLGGHGVTVVGGGSFHAVNVADGLAMRWESNPDRMYAGTLGGLIRFVSDERSEFVFWKVPLVASWFRRGSGDAERYRWRVGWGLVASGTETGASVLLIPVWRGEKE